MSNRIRKVNSVMREALASILLKDVDIGLEDAMVTVVEVNSSKDLRHATALVSVLPYEKGEEALEKLNSEIGHIQRELIRQVVLRYVPRIRFELDESEERASRLYDLMKKEREARESMAEQFGEDPDATKEGDGHDG